LTYVPETDIQMMHQYTTAPPADPLKQAQSDLNNVYVPWTPFSYGQSGVADEVVKISWSRTLIQSFNEANDLIYWWIKRIPSLDRLTHLEEELGMLGDSSGGRTLGL
jgi:hypothetical protein